ncbi:serine/threonine-protein kinase [Candidatus Uabimicrobium amorphum]|uniref:Protein kinase n=1 Tax=Uabimicrobium amorphum TaxID=2596890 RepID=A0A5S9IRH4_UABAM|nr:serine/threonine-protein kinase [Candidatus Uabimicrobium amorphum]BBM86778.1 protein kinase [Candidatus Uabimicrobium amorphum]
MVDFQSIHRLTQQPNKISPGTVLNNKYKITKLLGAGGMGSVYLAHTTSHHQVAIKHMHSNRETAMLVKRFVREYELLTKINHPNVVKVYDFFNVAQQNFIVMEYASGISLKELLHSSDTLPLAKRLVMATQIAATIKDLNKIGIIHRDIKPANILIDKSTWQIKILDLGLGKDIAVADRMTATGTVLGTSGYLSPEQVDAGLSKKSDVFSVAVTIYQMLLWQQRSPFAADTQVATMVNIAQMQLPPIHKNLSAQNRNEKNMHRQLSQILQHALQKKAYKRCDATTLYLELKKLQRPSFSASNNYKYIAVASIAIVLISVGMYLTQNTAPQSPKPKQKQNQQTQEQARKYFAKAQHDYYERRQYDESWQELQKALAIDPHNYRYLVQKAKMIFFGEGVQKNTQEAVVLAKKQINKLKNSSDGFSLYMLGYMYDTAFAVERDYQKAKYWYEKASAQSHVVAINNLAYMYQEALGVEKNYRKAAQLYKKAADLDYTTAIINLANLYMRGLGVRKNPGKVFTYYMQAAKLENKAAMYRIAQFYNNGYGVSPNAQESFRWYLQAAKNNYLLAFFAVAQSYELGRGTNKNAKQACFWYEKAAQNNDSEAMYRLAYFYKSGIGVEQNNTKARQLIQSAADLGHAKAKRVLNNW